MTKKIRIWCCNQESGPITGDFPRGKWPVMR